MFYISENNGEAHNNAIGLISIDPDSPYLRDFIERGARLSRETIRRYGMQCVWETDLGEYGAMNAS